MGSIGWTLCLIVFLTAGTLFFSTCAAALRVFSRVRLQEALKAANKEEHLDKFLESAEKLMWSCSLYRLIFNIGILISLLAFFSDARIPGPMLGNYFISALIAILIFLIFSLAIPHAWAKYGGEKILSQTYKFLMLTAIMLIPVLYVLKFTDAFVRRLAGVVETTPQEQQEEKQEEFLNGLEQHKMEGVVDEEEQEMIENVLELSETTVDEIMTPRTDIVGVEVNSNLQTILETINNAGHTRVPVYEEKIDRIIGFIYAKDLLSEIGKDPANFNLRDRKREAYFVPETKTLRVLLHEFQNQKLHIAVVLDEYGGTAGIVTLEDILEELVGEITDEYEKSEPEPIRKISENTFELDARTYVDDLNDRFELNLPEDEDYDTIGGFVFSYLGYIPKTGETFDYENMKFVIVAAEARKIKRIRIQLVESGT